jgi:hypothetical protein
MALKGNLRDFTITQLLNLINLARKTGSLVIEGPNETATVSFQEGKLAYAALGQEENGLGAILYKSKIITKAQYGTLRTRAANMSDKELGLLLINSGYVSQEDIIGSLQSHFMGVLSKLFTWVEGFFQFNANGHMPEDKIPVRMDLESIIIEGSRRIQEWEQLKEEIPNLDMALKFAERPGVDLQNINMSAEEWKVVSYVNPKNTINQIAQTTKIDSVQIRRIVYGLLQAGLVELIRPKGHVLPLPGLSNSIPGKTKEEQKNLVNRIIDRIRSL